MSAKTPTKSRLGLREHELPWEVTAFLINTTFLFLPSHGSQGTSKQRVQDPLRRISKLIIFGLKNRQKQLLALALVLQDYDMLDSSFDP